MSDAVAVLFEDELKRKGASFRCERDPERYVVQHEGRELCVSLDTLVRTYNLHQDESCVARFVDAVLRADLGGQSWQEVQSSVLFCLEPSDYGEPPDFRTPISERVDRVLVTLDASSGSIAWITPTMLADWQVSLTEAETTASSNLARALAEARIELRDVDGIGVAFFATTLPFKSALVLAPNLKQVVSPMLGWPLYAVIPDRDFLYLWAARQNGFIDRVGKIVVDEFKKAPYPITTEVFEIADGAIGAVGAFATQA